MVRMERLELSRLSAPEPKSGVYTNFTTSAGIIRDQKDINKGYGVNEGDRTLDRRSHNPELYQLSYAHHNY